MISRLFFTLLLLSWQGGVIASQDSLQASAEDKHLAVAMRMIGHQILLSYDDSTSRVLPVEQDGDRWKIQFDTELAFEPERLVATVDSVVKAAQIADRYIVEVEQCDSGAVVYSYEIWTTGSDDLVPCGGRTLEEDCYVVYVTLLQEENMVMDTRLKGINPVAHLTDTPAEQEESSNWIAIVIGGCLGITFSLLVFFWRRKKSRPESNDQIIIGGYHFDLKRMELSRGDERTELTHKEAALLFMLHASANTTLTREDLLRNVWGDEGDYVGRTLDVFISKLRKKLDADPDIKIVNVRGVGYKLVLTT